eukprot:TRINITY_DN13842_c0_g1_i4.p1 TRINITY_DN13842_c0_g1~~TRINITY_DN13842_c0_g1_i4.p1  ORF type:complete len:753 (+),score=152.31 TRINITY_DN13842_c0_g1_i4:146-2260(+)
MPHVCVLSGPLCVSHCCGRYIMLQDLVNGFPAWGHQKGTMYLYSDTDEGWSIVNKRQWLSDNTSGSIISSQSRHNGLPPSQVKDWCYGDGTSWILCPDIEITAYDRDDDIQGQDNNENKKRKALSFAANHNFQAAATAAVPRLPVDDFQVDYPFRYDNKSYLSRKELKWLKRAYDEDASRLAIGHNLELLRAALQKLGMLGSVDLFQLKDALREAMKLVNGKKTEGEGNALTLMEFLAVCDVLKARNTSMNENSSDADMLDAFVAMGGNRDHSGNIPIGFLQDTAEGFQLKLDNDMLLELDKDSNGIVDYNEFNTLLQSAGTGVADTFRLAGGVPEDPQSVVRIKQLLSSLQTLIEVGGVAQVNAVTWNLLTDRIDENKEITLREFTERIWLPLNLPEELNPCDIHPGDRDGVATLPPRSSSSQSDDLDGSDLNPNTALSLAAMLVGRKSRQHTRAELQSVTLQRRFDVLCRRLKQSTDASTSQQTKEKCTWLTSPLRHTFYFNTELLKRFLSIFASRSIANPLKKKVVGCVSNVVSIIEEHDSTCVPCKIALRENQEAANEVRGTLKSPMSSVKGEKVSRCYTLVQPRIPQDIVCKQYSRNPRTHRWKIEPAPPCKQSTARVYSRTRVGIEVEEFTDPVYVDSRGRMVPTPSYSMACEPVVRKDEKITRRQLGSTNGFLAREFLASIRYHCFSEQQGRVIKVV